MLHSQRQVEGVQERLGGGFRVVLGMRYGEPSIAAAMHTLAEEGIDRVVVFPMFPQFSCATTGSVYDAVYRAAQGRVCPFFQDRRRSMPAIHIVPPYYDHPAYIDSLKQRVLEEVAQTGEPDRYLITFHGIPKRYVDEGDPYRAQCETTADLLAAALGLGPDRWISGFQSRFGKEEWLQPYTEELLVQLGGLGVDTVVATCPGFTADCLETLDEIGNEGAAQLIEGGGKKLTLVPCLNDHPAWLDAMAAMVRQESRGWDVDDG
jgi:ferrochelatase